jgi:hypothetical protein
MREGELEDDDDRKREGGTNENDEDNNQRERATKNERDRTKTYYFIDCERNALIFVKKVKENLSASIRPMYSINFCIPVRIGKTNDQIQS